MTTAIGTMTRDDALALEADGDVSYRVRIQYAGPVKDERMQYRTTMRAATVAVGILADRARGYLSSRHTCASAAAVVIEAKRRTYWDNGNVKRGVNASPWRTVERVEVVA